MQGTDLKGKVAMVTGGSKGIGYAIAERLVGEGAKVFICARDEHELDAAVRKLSAGGEAAGEICDVRSEEQVKRVLEACKSRFGGLDILVNNAGIGILGKTVEEMSGDEFRRTLETNLFGVFYACHYAVPMMKERGAGYIINISSLAGQHAHPRLAAYNASKFGLNGFSEALMGEVRDDNIRVSWVCPGSVKTEFAGDAPTGDRFWELDAAEVAEAVTGLFRLSPGALANKIEIRATLTKPK